MVAHARLGKLFSTASENLFCSSVVLKLLCIAKFTIFLTIFRMHVGTLVCIAIDIVVQILDPRTLSKELSSTNARAVLFPFLVDVASETV